jgi:hypothetical protein
MTMGGWVIMVLSVGFVTGLLAWCIAKVLKAPEAPRKLHSQADIDTHEKP